MKLSAGDQHQRRINSIAKKEKKVKTENSEHVTVSVRELVL